MSFSGEFNGTGTIVRALPYSSIQSPGQSDFPKSRTMDPLSALSLACNILQLVETGVTVVAQAREAYKNGVLNEHDQLTRDVKTLIALNTELGTAIPNPSQAGQQSAAEARLVAANNECLRISRDFMELLAEIRIGQRTLRQSLVVSFRSLSLKRKLADLQAAVSESRATLSLAFLISMQYVPCLDCVSLRWCIDCPCFKERNSRAHCNILTSQDEVEARLLNAVNSTARSMESEIRSLTDRLEHASMETQVDSMSDFRSANQDKLDHLTGQLQTIIEQQTRLYSTIQPTQDKASHVLLESLGSPELDLRKEHVSEAYGKTYQWVLETLARSPCEASASLEDEQMCAIGQDNFLSWLRSQELNGKMFWIRGKPGQS